MAYEIHVSTSKRRLALLNNGRVVKIYPIGVGKMLTPTPKGTYTIINKQPNPGGPFGVMWMGLSKPHYEQSRINWQIGLPWLHSNV